MAVPFRYKFRIGQTMRFRSTTQVTRELPAEQTTPAPTTSTWSAIVVQRVVGMEPDGCAHLVTTAIGEHPDARAIEALLGGQHQVTYTLIDPIGRPRLFSTITAPTIHQMPSEPIGPGNEWNGIVGYPLPPDGHEAAVNLLYQYKENRKVEARYVAVIEFSAEPAEWTIAIPHTETQAMIRLEMRGQFWMDPSAGVQTFSELITTTIPREIEDAGSTTSHTTLELLALDYCAPGKGWMYPGVQ